MKKIIIVMAALFIGSCLTFPGLSDSASDENAIKKIGGNIMDIKERHEKLLYPVVRIFSKQSAGSGTIIYSKPDLKKPEEYQTFVLTNHHVVDSLIQHKEEWDSLLKRKIEKEFHELAKIEIFSYIKQSTVDSSNRYNAEILAYDAQHDLAILKLDSPKCQEFVAPLVPRDKIDSLRLFTPVAVSGCSMAHEPFVSFGELTYMKELIDQKRYWMYNAGSYFGNSGGALFLAETGEFIGVPSRLTGIQLGFGMDMVTFMGFAAHAERIYQFLEEQQLKFIFDPSDDYYKAMERRKSKQKEALMALKAEFLQNKAESESDN